MVPHGCPLDVQHAVEALYRLYLGIADGDAEMPINSYGDAEMVPHGCPLDVQHAVDVVGGEEELRLACYIVMAYIVMAYAVMAYVVMAYIAI